MTDYSEIIPEHLWAGLRRYLDHRLEPGSFLKAVLSNDLKWAVGYADTESMAALKDIVTYLSNNAGAAWGSRERVRTWLEGRS